MLDDETGEALMQRPDDTAAVATRTPSPPAPPTAREGCHRLTSSGCVLLWQALVNRLKEYHAQTTPIVNHYSPSGVVSMVRDRRHYADCRRLLILYSLRQINGDCKKEEVWNQIEKACPATRV